MVSNFINKCISFFANKKKILAISVSIIIILIVGFLYNTYATSTGVALGNEDNTYNILLTDSSNTVSVPAKSSKTVYYQFSNTNKGIVKYHIGYISDNCTAKVWWDTEDRISGTIEYGEYKFIKLKLINDTTEDDTITIKPVLGYVDGGDLVLPNDVTLVTGTIKEKNYATASAGWDSDAVFFGTTLVRKNIESVIFVNDNIIPSNALESFNLSDDGSVKLWYIDSNNNNLYEVYIGSDNGSTILNGQNGGKTAFGYMPNCKKIDLEYTDTSELTSMEFFFYNDSSLEDLNIINFDTSNVTSMYCMFSRCTSLTELDVSTFDTSNVTSFMNTFAYLNVNSLDVSNFDTSNATIFEGMFLNMKNISELNLNNFNMSLATNINSMFSGNTSLEFINLSNADLSNVIKYGSFLHNVSTSAKIYLKNTDSNKAFMNNNYGDYNNVNYIG